MDEYKSNSHKSKETEPAPEKRVSKIVSGDVKMKKRKTNRFFEIFLHEDIEDVKAHVIKTIIIPAIKHILSDTADILIWGEERRDSGRRPTAARFSYDRQYRKESDRYKDDGRSRVTTGYDYGDIVVPNAGDAHEILETMDELISTYGKCRVADLYEMIGITGNFTDNNYGWVDIHSAKPVKVRDGWLLKLPRALPLD